MGQFESADQDGNCYFPIAQWYQIVERKAGSKSLQVTAQVKAERASKAIIDVIFLDENSKMLAHEWASYIGAKEANDPPATHDWKEYSGKVKIPPQARKIQIGLQIYGPGQSLVRRSAGRVRGIAATKYVRLTA